jgi:hypothetical protein
MSLPEGVQFAAVVEKLGRVKPSHWSLLTRGVYLATAFIFLASSARLFLTRVLDVSSEGQRTEQLVERKQVLEQTLARAHVERGREASAELSLAAPRVDTVLEFVNESAKRSMVRVDSFTSDTGQSQAIGALRPTSFRFSAHGSFAALRGFVFAISQTTSGLILTELSVDNRSWPQFFDVLEARMTLEVVGPRSKP